MILTTSGASPARMMAAILWFGLLLGAVQVTLEARLRPAAVFAQVDQGFGDYAVWYRRDWMGNASWFVSGNTAVRAEVLRQDPPQMRDVMIFSGIRDPRLKSITSAARAVPGDTPFEWRLEGVRDWPQDNSASKSGTRTVTLDLIPEQLSYLHIQEFNIPTAPLTAIAARPDAPNASLIGTALWRRRTAWLLPGTFALLAVCLARAGFTGRVPVIPRLIALATVGFISVSSVKVFWALGGLAVLSPPVAVLAVVGLALALSAVLIWRQA